jgi:hypothetical protein
MRNKESRAVDYFRNLLISYGLREHAEMILEYLPFLSDEVIAAVYNVASATVYLPEHRIMLILRLLSTYKRPQNGVVSAPEIAVPKLQPPSLLPTPAHSNSIRGASGIPDKLAVFRWMELNLEADIRQMKQTESLLDDMRKKIEQKKEELAQYADSMGYNVNELK